MASSEPLAIWAFGKIQATGPEKMARCGYMGSALGRGNSRFRGTIDSLVRYERDEDQARNESWKLMCVAVIYIRV